MIFKWRRQSFFGSFANKFTKALRPETNAKKTNRETRDCGEDQKSVSDRLLDVTDLFVVAPLCRGASHTATERRGYSLYLRRET